MQTFTEWNGRTLRDFAVALWGACGGVLVSSLFLLILQPALIQRSEANQASLTWLTGFQAPPPWQSSFQKWMYLCHCVVCPLVGWLALQGRARLQGWACAAACVFFVPLISKVYRGLFAAEIPALEYVAVGIVFCLPVLLSLFWRRESDNNCQIGAGDIAVPAGPVPLRDLAKGAFLLSGLLAIFFLPRNINATANALTTELHLTNFFGPVLCLRDPAKVPGLDFESLYGVGHAYCYSFFFGHSHHAALRSYVWFMFAVIAFYNLSAYVVLSQWLRSARTGLIATLVLMLLCMEGLSYRWPSCWPMRFPFLFVFLGLASRAQVGGRSWLALLCAGMSAGLAFFWQTDNGLVLTVAGAVYYAALTVRERAGWFRVPLFLLSTAGAIAGLMLLAFGPRTLSVEFYRRLMEPLIEAGTGFGWHIMRWHFGWTYLYNLIGPLTALATLGWGLHQFGAGSEEEKRNARFLFLAGTVGLMMLFKWVNRAMDLAWTMNAAAIVVVMFWWIRCAVLAIAHYLETRSGVSERWGLRWSTLAGAACVLVLLLFGWAAGQFQPPSGMTAYSDSPLGRLHRFTAETPTLANSFLAQVSPVEVLPAVNIPVEPADTAFLQEHTSPKEPVALLAPFDWIYLAEADRPAAFHWIPVYYTHTHANVERVERNLRDARMVFVQRGSLDVLKTLQPSLHERVTRALQEQFVFADSGKNLDRYVRR